MSRVARKLRVVIVVGVAGVGKSTVLSHAKSILGEEGTLSRYLITGTSC